jgi:ribosome modulation factor
VGFPPATDPAKTIAEACVRTLTRSSPPRTIAIVVPPASNGATPTTAKSRREVSRWTAFWRPRAQPEEPPTQDALVASWKTAWSQGAQARWNDQSSTSNPHQTGHERSAWEAGWRWATRNPDRRSQEIQRLAHPGRRAGDAPPHLRRAIKLSVAGLTLLGISRLVHRWVTAPPRRDG